MKAWVVAAIVSACCSLGHAQTVSPLFARGYTVIPEPQKVTLQDSNFTFDQAWQLKLDSGVAKDDVAVDELRDNLASRFNIRLNSTGNADGRITLHIQTGSVAIGTAVDTNKKSLEEQAYRIDLHKGSI